jgi:hypothetical protein
MPCATMAMKMKMKQLINNMLLIFSLWTCLHLSVGQQVISYTTSFVLKKCQIISHAIACTFTSAKFRMCMHALLSEQFVQLVDLIIISLSNYLRDVIYTHIPIEVRSV